MSKKTFIVILIIFSLIFIILLGYYFLALNEGAPSGPVGRVFKSFFPFGNVGTEITPIENLPTEQLPAEQNNPAKKLRKLWSEPVAGAGVADFKAGTIVRYIEKATGHIFEAELFSANKNRISNTTIPLVYNAIWGNKNNSLIARYLKEDNQTVDTFSLTLKSTSGTVSDSPQGENTIAGVAFPRNISDISVFGSSIFYLVQDEDSSTGVISNFDGGNKKQIWNSPIKDVLSQFVNSRTVALTTKLSQNLPGFLYFVDTSSGQVRKILGDVLGLSTLTSPDANKVLFLENESGAEMSIFDQNAKSTVKITPTTFPEKCLWSRKDKSALYCAVPRESLDGRSLISWWQGFISFTDDIWKYDLKNNTSSLMENLSNDTSEQIDVIKPVLSDNEQSLIFINKRDNALWSLDLTK